MSSNIRSSLRVALLLAGAVSVIEILAGLLMVTPVLVADGLHTMLDVVVFASLYIGLGPILKPPDLDHPYGHYKYRYLSMYTVAILIIIAALWLAAETVSNMVRGVVERAPWSSIYVITVVIGLVLSRLLYLRLSYARTKDIILSLESRHAAADLLDSLMVAATVVVSEYLPLIQSIAVLAIAAYLMYLGGRYFKESVDTLLDRINPSIIDEVRKIANDHNIQVTSIRVKNVGNGYALDLVVKMSGQLSVNEAHRLVDDFENDIKGRVKSVVTVNTHIEPGD